MRTKVFFTRIVTIIMLAGLLAVSPGLVACTSHRDPVKVNAGGYPSYLCASACQAKNGDILVFTRVGTTHATDRGKIVFFRSCDGGITWGEAKTLAEDPAYDCRNPISVCLPNGRMLVGHAVYEYREGLLTQPNRILYSDDNGETWSDLATVDSPPYFASAGNIVVVPGTGDLLLPCEDTTMKPWRAVILASTDGGVTWVERASLSVAGHFFNEPTLAYTERGKLLCVIRDETYWYYWVVESTDNGETWSEPVPYPQLTGSQPVVARVGEYMVLLSREELTPGIPGIRSPGLTLYSSKNGTVWWGKRYLWRFSQTGGGFHASYGSVLPVTCNTFLTFFSVEKIGWFDSGVYCIPLTSKEVVFQGKSLPVRLLDLETLSAGISSHIRDCRELPIEDADSFALTIECTYSASADSGVQVHIYSSYDGLNYDTQGLRDSQGAPIFGNLSFIPNERICQTKDIVCSSRFVKVAVENKDKSQPVMNVRVTAVISR